MIERFEFTQIKTAKLIKKSKWISDLVQIGIGVCFHQIVYAMLSSITIHRDIFAPGLLGVICTVLYA